jgi:hypothetical protein
MTRARTFLVYGFAISLAIHAITLPFIHAQSAQAHEDVPHVLAIEPMPTPPPTPPATPTDRAPDAAAARETACAGEPARDQNRHRAHRRAPRRFARA